LPISSVILGRLLVDDPLDQAFQDGPADPFSGNGA
jgi:hypothetical protein